MTNTWKKSIEYPKTIQEKLIWLKENEKSIVKENCKDNLKLREYLKNILGKDFCAPISKIYKKTNEIEWDILPQSFVIKSNIGENKIVIKDVNFINKNEVTNEVQSWLKNNTNKIIIENYIINYDTVEKYSIWFFNGVAKLYTISGFKERGYCNFYDTKNRFLKKIYIDGYGNDEKIENIIPSHIQLMKEYGKKICAPFSFAICDFYLKDNEIFLDKLIFEPYECIFSFKEPLINYYIGDLLILPLKKKKNVIYTCITGEYEIPVENKCKKSDDFDYICFTNCDIKSDFWEIRPLPGGLNHLSNVKKQRWVKINAHKVLPEYDFSIWVDGNVQMGGSINQFLDENIKNNPFSFYVGAHPQRESVYKEGEVCIELKKDTQENINKQLNIYKAEGLPDNFGLVQTCMLFRYHNDADCIKLMEAWWAEMEKYGHRDQLSFPYVLWKTKIKIGILNKKIFKSEFFRRIPHNKK